MAIYPQKGVKYNNSKLALWIVTKLGTIDVLGVLVLYYEDG